MKSFRKIALAMVAVSALSVAAVAPTYAHARPHSSMDSLVIKITTTSGTTWGKVSLDYSYKGKMHMGGCSKAKCTLHTPAMVKLTLTEKPTHPSTWPFHSWTLKNGSAKAKTEMGKKLKFEIMGGMSTVTANYVVA